MGTMTQETVADIREQVYRYFSEECDIPVSDITDTTNIISELEGDSLMLLSLLEMFRKKYELKVELKTLGKRLMKEPANTVGQVIDLTVRLVQSGGDLAQL
jgi:acyl carrier protein